MRFAAAGRAIRILGAASLALASLSAAGPAVAADQPKVPEQVASYFADGLIPRLIDLYGAGDGVSTGIDFDATTVVGRISRVLEWTPDFLAGKPTDAPTRLTNNWVAPVSLRGAVIGLATVWINPADDLPELATFNPPALAGLLAAAPPKSLLVRDVPHSAWFAIDGEVLTPLVEGNSGATAVTTPDAYQRTISNISQSEQSERSSPGVLIAGIVLGAVVVLLAIFVLLPDRRRRKATPEDPEPEVESARPDGPVLDAATGPTVTPASGRKSPASKGAPQKAAVTTSPTRRKPATGPAVLREKADDR